MALHTTTRRGFLVSGTAAVASAGCLGLADPGSETRRELELTLSRWDGSLRDRYVVDLSETRPAWSEAAFEATLDGSAYTTQYRTPFFASEDSPRYTRSDGTFYELGSVVVDEERESRPVLRLYEATGDDGDSSPSGVASGCRTAISARSRSRTWPPERGITKAASRGDWCDAVDTCTGTRR